MLLVLKILAMCIGFYIVNASILFLCARIRKDTDGTPILDTSSWHYRIAYPFGRDYCYDPISECVYFLRLTLMLYIGWPLMILGCLIFWILESIKLVLYTPVLLLVGRYPTPIFRPTDIRESFEWYDALTLIRMDNERIPLPRIKNIRVLPLYPAILGAFIWALIAYPAFTLHWTKNIFLYGVLPIGIISGIFFLVVEWRDKEDEPIIIEWVSTKKSRICRTMKVR